VLALTGVSLLAGQGGAPGGTPAPALPAGAPPAAPVADAETVYIAAGGPFSYLAVAVPLPARRLGAVALEQTAALARGARPAAPLQPQAAARDVSEELLGAAPAGLPPAGWNQTGLASAAAVRQGSAPFGADDEEQSRDFTTSLGDTSEQRIAALYATREFAVPAGPRPALLVLRVRYNDGLVVYLNGREVARRNLAPQARPVDLAERPHGPEWETFHIPVQPDLLRDGRNLLAVEVHPSSRRLAPILDLGLGARHKPRLVRGPLVQRVTASSAVILFDTDLPVRAAVEYGATETLGQRALSAGGALAVHHTVELRGLPPHAAVHYRLRVAEQPGPVARFHTAPAGDEVVRFAVYGDSRGGHDAHAALLGAMLGEAPDFALATGDLVMRGSDEADWQRFFAVASEFLARIPLYPVAGNHDLGRSGDEQRRLNEIFALWPPPAGNPEWAHWYSFAVAGLHFVMLDSNAYDEPAQLAWLRADLQAARQRGARAIFALAHDGPYSRGVHGGNLHAAEHYVPVLVEHGVTLMFSGHDHIYQRGEVGGLRYFVSGGGGAPLYAVRCGIPGRPRCSSRPDDGMQFAASVHHYLAVTVYPTHLQVCPKGLQGEAIESCQQYPLDPRRRPER
jgi:hypothetical protein